MADQEGDDAPAAPGHHFDSRGAEVASGHQAVDLDAPLGVGLGIATITTGEPGGATHDGPPGSGAGGASWTGEQFSSTHSTTGDGLSGNRERNTSKSKRSPVYLPE